ncbi:MAG: EamA family transporter [bacterium]|nr:EamA family transporter [bacterium]
MPRREPAGTTVSARPLLEAPSRNVYLVVVLGLFLIWSNSFVAASHLLGTERGAAQFNWLSLTTARCAPIAPLCLLYCFLFRRQEALGLLRRFPLRLGVGGLLAVPGYNLALYFGQQHGVPPSVAALTTALLPLFVVVLAAVFLNERLSSRKAVGFLIAVAGLFAIAMSRGALGSTADYGVALGVTALAPLQYAAYSILSKPAMAFASPLTWTYLAIGLGGMPLMLVLPWAGAPEMAALEAPGWTAVLYLSVLCTLVGYAVWCWLLRHLPASTVGFTVFLNPPLATASKALLTLLFPAVFVWQLTELEWLGGGVVLAGVAFALWPRVQSSTLTE